MCPEKQLPDQPEETYFESESFFKGFLKLAEEAALGSAVSPENAQKIIKLLKENLSDHVAKKEPQTTKVA